MELINQQDDVARVLSVAVGAVCVCVCVCVCVRACVRACVHACTRAERWLGSRVVSALDSGAEGPMNACVLLAFLSRVIMHLSGVRPSVRLFVPFGHRKLLLQVCCCWLSMRANAGSATLSAYVGSWALTCHVWCRWRIISAVVMLSLNEVKNVTVRLSRYISTFYTFTRNYLVLH